MVSLWDILWQEKHELVRDERKLGAGGGRERQRDRETERETERDTHTDPDTDKLLASSVSV